MLPSLRDNQGQSGCGIFPLCAPSTPGTATGPGAGDNHPLMPTKFGESAGLIRFRENPSSGRLCGAPGRGGGLGETFHRWQHRGSGGGDGAVPAAGSVRRSRALLRFSALPCDSSGTPGELGDIRREAAALHLGAGKQQGEARKSGSGAAFSRAPAGNADRRTDGLAQAARAGLRGRGGASCLPAAPRRSAAGIGGVPGVQAEGPAVPVPGDPSGHGQGAVPPGTALEEPAPPAGAGPTGARFSFL